MRKSMAWNALRYIPFVLLWISSITYGSRNSTEELILILPDPYYAFSGDFEVTLITPVDRENILFNDSLSSLSLNFNLEQVGGNKTCPIEYTFINHEVVDKISNSSDLISNVGYSSLLSLDRLTRQRQRLKFFDCPCLQRPDLYKIKARLIEREKKNEINHENPEKASLESVGDLEWAFEENFRVMMPNISVLFMKKGEGKEIGVISQWSDNMQIKVQTWQPFHNISMANLILQFWNFSVTAPPAIFLNLTLEKHWQNETLIDLPCEMFNKPGLWTVSLKISANNIADEIFRSSSMRVNVSGQYKLKMATRTIFPCYSPGISISFDFPSTCPKIYYEKGFKSGRFGFSHFIRLYGVLRNFSQRGKRVMKYLAEKRIARDRAVLDFNCNYFDLIYFEYCFVFVTLFDDGTVFEHDRKCQWTQESRYNPIDGGWSSWSSWGSCAVTCGRGVRSRVRLCNYPKPKYYGRYCPGRGLDIELCEGVTDCRRFDRQMQFSTDRCKCGCSLNQSEDVIVINLPSCKHASQLKWVIESDSSSSRVFLKILSTNFLYGIKQALYVRSSASTSLNSSDSNDILLYAAFHDPENFEEQHETIANSKNVNHRKTWIASRSNLVIIEYYISWSSNFTFSDTDRTFYGAVIKYKFFETSNNEKYFFSIDQAMASNIFIPLICIICLLIVLIAIFYCLFVKAQNRIKIGQNSNNSEFGRHHRSCKLNPESMMIKNSALNDNEALSTTVKVQITPLSRAEVEDEKKPLLLLLRRKSSNLPKIPEEMQISTYTQSTRLSAMTQNSNDVGEASPRLTGKNFRSIGIQLNSPALLLKRHSSSESKFSASTAKCSSVIVKSTNQKGGTDVNDGNDVSPNLSWTGLESQPDFEYDYSEFAVPGSVLNPGAEWPSPPQLNLHSEIFIDDIIAQSELMTTTTIINHDAENLTNSKTSISTQVYHLDAMVNDEEDDNCQKLFDNLQFSTSQFHYL